MSSEGFTGSKVPQEDYGYDILSPGESKALGDRALANLDRMLAAPAAGNVHDADVEMFPQEGIVVGEDPNSERAVQTFNAYADTLFAIDDHAHAARRSIPTSPEASGSDPSKE